MASEVPPDVGRPIIGATSFYYYIKENHRCSAVILVLIQPKKVRLNKCKELFD